MKSFNVLAVIGLSVGLVVPIVAKAQNGHNCDRGADARSRILSTPAYLSEAASSRAESPVALYHSPWQVGQASGPLAAKTFEIPMAQIAALVPAEAVGVGKEAAAPAALPSSDYVTAGIMTEEPDLVAGALADLGSNPG